MHSPKHRQSEFRGMHPHGCQGIGVFTCCGCDTYTCSKADSSSDASFWTLHIQVNREAPQTPHKCVQCRDQWGGKGGTEEGRNFKSGHSGMLSIALDPQESVLAWGGSVVEEGGSERVKAQYRPMVNWSHHVRWESVLFIDWERNREWWYVSIFSMLASHGRAHQDWAMKGTLCTYGSHLKRDSIV